VRHAHLDHCDLVLGFQLQQLQRQSEMVVQIALRLQHEMPTPQNMGNYFLGRRLTCGTGYPNQRLAPQFPHGRGKLLQREKRIIHGE
jgi:hypothetical protein